MSFYDDDQGRCLPLNSNLSILDKHIRKTLELPWYMGLEISGHEFINIKVINRLNKKSTILIVPGKDIFSTHFEESFYKNRAELYTYYYAEPPVHALKALFNEYFTEEYMSMYLSEDSPGVFNVSVKETGLVIHVYTLMELFNKGPAVIYKELEGFLDVFLSCGSGANA